MFFNSTISLIDKFKPWPAIGCKECAASPISMIELDEILFANSKFNLYFCRFLISIKPVTSLKILLISSEKFSIEYSSSKTLFSKDQIKDALFCL